MSMSTHDDALPTSGYQHFIAVLAEAIAGHVHAGIRRAAVEANGDDRAYIARLQDSEDEESMIRDALTELLGPDFFQRYPALTTDAGGGVE